jgi:hypothetical protein
MTDTHKHYRLLRLVVRSVFTLGVLVSLAANVLHADNNLISQAIAAWAPIALLLTVELISRVPSTGTWRSIIRITATIAVAAIAAWVSYWHMVGVAERYGETGWTPYLLPISVDSLIVVASVSLVEVNHRIRQLDTTTTTTTTDADTGSTMDHQPPPVATPAPHTAQVVIPPETTNQLLAGISRRSPPADNRNNGTVAPGMVQDRLL